MKLSHTRVTVTVAVVGALASMHALGQQHLRVPVPNAGSILQQKKSESRDLEPLPGVPAADSVLQPPASQKKFQIKHFSFEGNRRVSTTELEALVQPYVGRALNQLQLEQLAEAVSNVYRSHGYGFTSTVVDPRGLEQGEVRFSIVEGKAGKIGLHNTSRTKDWLLQGALSRFEQHPENTDSLERASLLMSDTPGVASATPRLSRGETPGTVDVTMEVERAPLLSGYASIDNYGSRSSGRGRMNAMLGLNSPFGWGDSLRLSVSGMPFHSDGDSTLGGANYDFPIGNGGLRGGVGYNRLQYHLGGIYAGYFDGTADVVSGYASYPLIRQQMTNLFARVTYSHSLYRDNQVGYENKRHSNAVALMLYGNHQDLLFGRNGATRYSTTLTLGSLTYDSPDFAQQDAYGSKTAGGYTKLEGTASRMQQLTNSTYVQAELLGQYAFKNLDGSSRMVLGGPSGVRAFSSDFVSVDSGLVLRATVGWRLPLPVPVPITAYAFFDAASGVLRHDPISGGANNVNLQGAGIGVDASYRNLTGSVSVARRVGGQAPGLKDQPKTWVWASLAYGF